MCAEHCLAKNEDFAILFGDDLIKSTKPALAQLINVYKKTNSSVIGVQKILKKEIENYGVIDYIGKINQSAIQIKALVEKPKATEAPSSLGIVGKYICKYNIFNAIKNGNKSSGGELRLIDGFKYLIEKKQEKIFSKILTGIRYDTGSKAGWLKANIAFALEDTLFKKEILNFIKTL